MNGEQRDVVIYVAVHVREILGKLLQMVADELALLVVLVEHTFLGDILHILLRNSQRAVAVVDMEQHLTSELEFWSIVYHFLHTKGDTELRLVCNLSQCLQYLQVAVQLVSTTASFQIGQHFVDDQEKSLIGIFLFKRRHHFLQFHVVILKRCVVGQRVIHSEVSEEFIYLIADNSP